MPGAATLASVRWLDVAVPKDGTVIAMFDPALIIGALNLEAVEASLARVRFGAMLPRYPHLQRLGGDRHPHLGRP